MVAPPLEKTTYVVCCKRVSRSRVGRYLDSITDRPSPRYAAALRILAREAEVTTIESSLRGYQKLFLLSISIRDSLAVKFGFCHSDTIS